ncbi:ABC transporter ATP-binding protein [Halorubrum lacusprofundi]|jgi:ABC-2 type transport system ATP-binding protein|uniref:ABC transporter related n=1 Tax=Halorubrum lacusprofundi (strain ATCC 49239 / DSM 5036 / JCM 8891 / ACAM 34) TaxID=416348 RepID=B9LS85_HALLT|nr:ABC transporter ATP-binding protein [Halorubrum lacusprofundi]ACM55930.1 ABC transporter related [Halorubrum lacusprofundi ATCC 49239]MCG1006799.1 ABC transporter ATP-binding protein [Halorubrum lacusprofundi]
MNETTAADVDAADDATRGRDAAGADAADPDAVVVGEGVRKSYGDVVALDGVDIRVESGEVFGLIGPNGAGKTTLVRALTGTTEAEGDLRVFGVPPREVDPQRIGLLPQSFDPPERLTATELVGYYGGLYDAARDAESVLRDVGMADDADVWYETLSGGQKRRTCVATAIVNDPDLLFLDEPTTGIDPAGRRSIHRLIERLAGGGTTVFLTSHAMDEVERLADRVALLRDGKIVAVGAPEELIADHGGEPRLEVKLDGPASEADCEAVQEAIREALSDESAGESEDAPAVESTRKGLRIGGVRPEGIGDAVDALETAEIDFESLAWSEPSLEDVYLRLTGEEYSPRSEPLDEVAPDGGDR